MIIAIDGPAAAGKGTLALRLAAHYGLPLPRHRPALPAGRARTAAERGLVHRRRGGGRSGRGDARPGETRRPDAARPRGGRACLAGRGPPGRARRAGRVPARFRAPAGRRRARRARHRHGDLPRGGREDLRHGERRRARPAADRRNSTPRAATSPTRRILAEIQARDARDSGRATAPLAQAARRALARYLATWI